MFCANCGTKQNEGEKFCPNCGTRFEEPKTIKKEVSTDASKQSISQNEIIELPKGKTEGIKEEVKVVEKTDVDSSVVSSTQNETVDVIQAKNEEQNEVIKLNAPIVEEPQKKTAIENPDANEPDKINITPKEESVSTSENVILEDAKIENVEQGITKSNDSIMKVESKEEAAIDDSNTKERDKKELDCLQVKEETNVNKILEIKESDSNIVHDSPKNILKAEDIVQVENKTVVETEDFADEIKFEKQNVEDNEQVEENNAISTINDVANTSSSEKQLKNDVIISEEKQLENASIVKLVNGIEEKKQSEIDDKKRKIDNSSLKHKDNNSFDKTNEIIEEPIINYRDEESVLRWAIRYELGLGVPVNSEKAEELYAKIKTDNIVLKSLCSVNIDEKTGIISDACKIKYDIYFDSEVEKRREEEEEERRREEQRRMKEEAEERRKQEAERRIELEKKRKEEEKRKKEEERRRQAEKQKREQRIKEMYNTTNRAWKRIKFKFYIEATSEQIKQLKDVVGKYNNEIRGTEYSKIIFNEQIMSVEGIFEKMYTSDDIGFLRSWLLISEMDKQRERYLRQLFVDTCDFCESLKMK